MPTRVSPRHCRAKVHAYMMAGKGNNYPECFITRLFRWVVEQFSRKAERLLVMDQSLRIVLGGELPVQLLKYEILRVCQHMVESCRTFKADCEP